MGIDVAPILLCAALGGALGSMARAGLSLWLVPLWRAHWVILAINLSGSLVLGVLWGALGGAMDDPVWAFVAVGVLGGFTTVSTFALQAHLLWAQARGSAVAYVLLSGLGGPVAAVAGWGLF